MAEEAPGAREWLKKLWGDPKVCPFCNMPTHFEIEPSQALTASGDPLHRVSCQNCGLSVFLDSRKVPEPGV